MDLPSILIACFLTNSPLCWLLIGEQHSLFLAQIDGTVTWQWIVQAFWFVCFLTSSPLCWSLIAEQRRTNCGLALRHGLLFAWIAGMFEKDWWIYSEFCSSGLDCGLSCLKLTEPVLTDIEQSVLNNRCNVSLRLRARNNCRGSNFNLATTVYAWT